MNTKTRGQLDNELYQIVSTAPTQRPLYETLQRLFKRKKLADLNNAQMEQLIPEVRKAYDVELKR